MQLAGLVDPDALADDGEAVARHALAVWNALTEPGDGVAGRLIAALGAVDALTAARSDTPDTGAIAEASGVSPAEYRAGRRRWRPRLDAAGIGAGWEVARRHGIRLLQPGDRDWPSQLGDLGAHAPLGLWVRGDPAALGRLQPSVALVGARAATAYGEHVASQFASDLAARGIGVVSGAAYGIDGAAHRAALGAGGLTVALLAGGVERPYPAGHAHLIGRIAEGGAVASEVPCGSAPTRWRFLQRNRLISALSDATVVVEAGWRSGSLNTAAHAASLGRPLGAVPGPITSATSAVCHRLIREFDARCVTTPDEVRELAGDTVAVAWSERGRGARTDDSTRVRDALSTRTWRETVEIARQAGMDPDEVGALLGFFALEGDVERGPRGWRLVTDAR
ncbi:DNA-protecting protein DprA [Microbacterium rhizomatis]|uniref:DNA-protecting protein DprA n=2 Tax=Microbacterium rhizomatis TaxID=1631477 RepID=A0A5J5J9B7_9MICO|nr:DNA-protecting protein DprA [Microbacterium rhizomatis]